MTMALGRGLHVAVALAAAALLVTAPRTMFPPIVHLDDGAVPALTLTPPVQTELVEGVACPVEHGCVAVGYASSSTTTFPIILTEGASGRWGLRSSLSAPAGESGAQMGLDAVSCASAVLCVAVGQYALGGSSYPMEVREAHGVWGVPVSLTLPTGAKASPAGTILFNAVDCVSSSACTAVGQFDSTMGLQNLAETEVAGSWSPATTPLPATAISGPDLPQGLNGVSCSAPGRCVAVGVFDQDGAGGSVLGGFSVTEEGGQWQDPVVAPLPANAAMQDGAPLFSALGAVSCWSPGDCVAVGGYDAGTPSRPVSRSIELTMSGGVWRFVVGIEPVVTLQCFRGDACDLVGIDDGPTSWHGWLLDQRDVPKTGAIDLAPYPLPLPADATPQNGDGPPRYAQLALTAMACVAPNQCTIVGSYSSGKDAIKGLVIETSTLPGAPTISSVSPSTSRLVVRFRPPATDGGQPIRTYQVSVDGGRSWRPANVRGTATVLVVDHPDAGAARVEVRAVNAVGDGPASAPTVVTVP